MPLKDFSELVESRVRREPAFGIALLDEAVLLFLNGGAGCGVVGAPGSGEWDDRV
jgi:hypothetical protein